jgi:hypothetical protein
MATAFQSGFKLGGDAYNQSQRNRLAEQELELAKGRDARAAEEFEQRREEYQRQRTKNAEVDSITQQLTRPNAENYSLARGMAPATGLRTTEAMPSDAGDTASVPPIGGLRMPAQGGAAAATGLRTPTMTDRPMTFNAAPTGASAEELLGRISLVKGDTAGFRASQANAKNFKYEDGLKSQYAAWDAMTDDDRFKLVDKISLDQGIPGNGTWVAGKGKQPGYMNWTPPGKDPIKLSAKEARDLYALTNLMDVDPIRARAEMDKVSAQVRALAKDTFDTQSKGVTANNQATRFANADANDAARTGLLGQELGIKGQVAQAQIGSYTRANRSPIELLTAEAERLAKDGTFKDVPTAIEALKKGSVKREVDPKAYAETMAKFNEVYGDPVKARMATDQAYGLTAPTNAVADRLKALNDNKGGVKPGAAPAAAPAAPLGLQQRLGNAIGADNNAGNRNQFTTLADEASKNAPAMMQQLEVLRRSLPMTRSAGERENLENRIGELESDLGLYRSILDQRRAQWGY